MSSDAQDDKTARKRTAGSVRSQETLRDRIAQAVHRVDCGCTDEPGQYDDYYLSLAAVVLPIVEEETKAARAAAWQEGFDAGENMAHMWGHVDHWEDWPANPYMRALVEEPQGGEQ